MASLFPNSKDIVLSALFICTVLGGSLDVAAILEFIDSGHDVVLAAEGGASDVVRDIATECGVDLDEVSWLCEVEIIFHALGLI